MSRQGISLDALVYAKQRFELQEFGPTVCGASGCTRRLRLFGGQDGVERGAGEGLSRPFALCEITH